MLPYDEKSIALHVIEAESYALRMRKDCVYMC